EVIHRRRQGPEERVETIAVGGVECGVTARPDVRCGPAKALGGAGGGDPVCPLGVRQPGGLESDAGATTDDHDGLPEQGRFPHGGRAVGDGAHDASDVRAGGVTTLCSMQVSGSEQPWTGAGAANRDGAVRPSRTKTAEIAAATTQRAVRT